METSILDRITIDAQVCGGRPCIRGMRIRVIDILEMLAAGMMPTQIVEEHPDLEVDDVMASLRYAAHHFDHPVLVS